ncbi:hypothetical protein KEJ44_06735 [Candidatus Bathyarchaeota archaeon]|nr:hypothetical protein [Candidatus Bathyarchaeota archaeon]
MAAPLKSFLNEAHRIVEASEVKGIPLRVIGAVAIRIHCPNFGHLQDALGRAFSDIDFVSYSRFGEDIKEIMKNLGYVYDEVMAKVFEVEFGHVKRMIFLDEENKRHCDVFFDKLEFSHDIPLEGRIEVDRPTIPLAELLLTKMQIVKINMKDLIDAAILLREHSVGETDRETVNAKIVAGLCANDWGLWKTVTDNLRTLKDISPSLEALNERDRADLAIKIDRLLGYIDREPKSRKWKLRAAVGTRKKWYRDVEEVSR